MSEWLKTLVGYMLIVSISIQMLPKEKYERYVRLFTGFLLLVLVIQPLLKAGSLDNYLETKILEFVQEQERLEQERLEQERLEQERLEQERLEQERLEQERLEQERLEQERLEQQKQQEQNELTIAIVCLVLLVIALIGVLTVPRILHNRRRKKRAAKRRENIR